MLLDCAKHGFDIKHWRAVDGFDGTNSQTFFADVTNDHLVKTDGIGPVWRARREHSAKSSLGVGTRMHL